MLPSINRAAGGNVCFPDVCNTPAGPATIPIPYPNISFSAQSFPFCFKVRTSYVNALNMGSQIPMSTGDEPGVAHPMFKAISRFILGCIKVFFEGLPAINLTSMANSNNMNAPLGGAFIPSITNVFLSDAQREWTLMPPAGTSIDAGHDLMGSGAWRAALLPVEAASALAEWGPKPVRATLLQGGLGYLRIERMSIGVPSQLARALEQLQARGMTGAIIDLCGNPGGPWDVARRLLEELLPRGAIIGRLREPDGDERVIRSRHNGASELPLWILIDRHTASAAEIVAGGLQWHGRARIVGETSYGKGRAQVARQIAGGLLYADAFCCLLPDGTAIDGRGVIPDVMASAEEAVSIAAGEHRRGQ